MGMPKIDSLKPQFTRHVFISIIGTIFFGKTRNLDIESQQRATRYRRHFSVDGNNQSQITFFWHFLLVFGHISSYKAR